MSQLISSATGLQFISDALANLQLSVNANVVAVTFNNSGAMGFGSTPAYGSSGNVLVSLGNASPPMWVTPAVAGIAKNGANNDITALTGLLTPLSVGQGGTGVNTSGTAGTILVSAGGINPAVWQTLTAAGIAKNGPNNDITSLSGLTTPLSTTQGGTGTNIVGAAGNILVSNGTSFVSKLPDNPPMVFVALTSNSNGAPGAFLGSDPTSLI